MNTYLGTEAAAAYLGIKERKLYELAAQGAVPCSKVTGKWLFPQAALDRWIESGLAQPVGMVQAEPPPIIGGSHDPLLDWAARRSGSGLALLSEGSLTGFRKLERHEVAIAAIHLHANGTDAHDEDANRAAMRQSSALHDGVLIGFAQREQGLLLAPGNPLGVSRFGEAIARGLRFGQRQAGAGAQQLMGRLIALAGAAEGPGGPHFETGQDLAFAIRTGEIDCGIATQAVALANGLAFVPLLRERFDLAMRRRTFFEPAMQMLFRFMQGAEFRLHTERLGGYDLGEAGVVRCNR